MIREDRSSLGLGMKYLMAGLLALLCGFFLADFLFRQPASEVKLPGMIPFDHSLHGDSIGLDCLHCHAGAAYQAHAYMPSKADCMDCHSGKNFKDRDFKRAAVHCGACHR